MLKYPAWQKPYKAATQETDSEKLTALVYEAEAAIFERMLALSSGHGEHDERQAIQDACQSLFVIKTEILKWPNPYGGSTRAQAASAPE